MQEVINGKSLEKGTHGFIKFTIREEIKENRFY